VLVVDDSETFRAVAASLLSAAEGLRRVGEASSGEEAIRLLPELKPDLVLLDVHMPGMGGLETARVIRRESPETVVVLVSADPASVAADAPHFWRSPT
jgi:CheY-like chemotaxis protein